MSGTPRPGYFVARADGTLTPMIAVDELPSSINILGVPATITPAGTQNMVSLGLKERSSQPYVVQFAEDIQITSDTEKNPSNKELVEGKEVVKEPERAENIRAEEKGIDELKANVEGKQAQEMDAPVVQQVGSWRAKAHKDNEVDGNRPTVATAPEEIKNKEDNTSSAETTSKIAPDSPPTNLPSKAAYGGMGTTGTLGKKVYCTHWIRWGECDYTQQGCLYKHEMPDERKLQEIGIATYPRWYRIANPEKFNGETEGPVWHRRPGPAPTDQLWRGPPPARPVEPQTYEDFRSNARPAPAQGPIQRQQFGSRSNTGSGPIIFAYDPIGSTFHPLAAFNNFRSNGTEQAPRQSYDRIPPPKVVTMRDPFARQQRPTFTGVPSNSAEQTNSSTFTSATTNAGASVSLQPQGSITEINEPAPADGRPEQPLKQSAATSNADKVGISNAFQPSPSKTSPNINGSGYADKSSSSSASGSSPPKLYHNSKFNNHSMTNGNHLAGNYGQHQSRNGYHKSTQNLNEAYQPLVPSPMSHSVPINDGKPAVGMEKRFVPAPATPPVHRRFFVPPGQSKPTANTNGTSGHSYANGGSGSNRGSRKDGNVLLDI